MIKKEHNNTLKNPKKSQLKRNTKNFFDKYSPHTKKNFVDVMLTGVRKTNHEM